MIKGYKNTILEEDGKTINDKEFRDVLLDNGKKIPEHLTEVKKNTKDRIYNIVGDGAISSLMIHLIKYNLIKLTTTHEGVYDEELEVKVKNTSIDDIEKYLGKSLEKDVGCISPFEGNVSDVYFTDNKKGKKGKKGKKDENGLKNADTGKKCSLRIREKIKTVNNLGKEIPEENQESVYYCTLKRKLEVKNVLNYLTKEGKEVDIEFRGCYEEEFEIKSPILFYKLFLLIKLYEFKSKTKKRKQLVVNEKLVLDSDKYNKINNLIEFEATEAQVAAFYMDLFGVINNEKSAGGSGTLDKESNASIIRYRI